MAVDYGEVLNDALRRLTAVRDQIEELESEESSLMQFLTATLPLLPQEDREQFAEKVDREIQKRAAQGATLTQAVRDVLRSNQGEWFTAAEVRNALMRRAFDFSAYTSNPLPSVSTTVKRITEKEAGFETRDFGGVAAYRYRQRGQPTGMTADEERIKKVKEIRERENKEGKR